MGTPPKKINIADGMIAAGLKKFRKDFHLAQREVAEILGITLQAYQAYEYETAAPPSPAIILLAKKFNVTTDYLLGLSDSPRPVPADKDLVNAIVACRDSIQLVLAEVDKTTAAASVEQD